MILLTLLIVNIYCNMDWQSRHYGYYENAMEVWDKFPKWLNQKYYEKCNNINAQDIMLLNARQKITQEIMEKLTRQNGNIKSYYYRIPKSMILKNVIKLTKELSERFDDVDITIPYQPSPNTSTSKFISIDDYDPLSHSRPNAIRINFKHI